MFVCHGDVHRRQHHENECLKNDDEDVEYGPGPGQHAGGGTCNQPAHRKAGNHAQQPKKHEYQLARVHVAKQPHTQRNRLGEQFNDVQHEVGDPQRGMTPKRRGKQLMKEATHALCLEAEEKGQKKHRE